MYHNIVRVLLLLDTNMLTLFSLGEVGLFAGVG